MMTKDEAQEVHRHRALCHPQLFPQLFSPMSCPTSCVGFKSKSPNISPFVPHTLPKYIAMSIPPHVLWKTMPLQKQMAECFSQALIFTQILAYSQFHKFLSMITNHGGWWMVRGVIGASSCPTKPSTAVNQLQPKSCRKPPKRTTPYHVGHIITGTTCVLPWQPGANHGNLVTAIIPAVL